MPARISATIIAKDEADRIGPCLESVRFADEVVVLDSGSRDGTRSICRDAGARVIDTDWPGWVAQKNRAAREASNDWVLSLDADERVDETLRERILALRDTQLERADTPRAYEVCRRVFYMNRWLGHGGWYPEWRIRLFDKNHANWGGTDPHDRVETAAPVGRIREGHLEHYTYRSLEDQVAQIQRHSTAAAAALFARGTRVGIWPAVLRPPFHFARHYLLRLGFLDGTAGLVMCGMRSFYVFLKYAKLWELGRASRSSEEPTDPSDSVDVPDRVRRA